MKISVITVGEPLRSRKTTLWLPLEDYLLRIARYVPCTLADVGSEAKLLETASKASGRAKAVVVLTDSRGRQVSSPEFAELIRQFRDAGHQQLIFAVGPADGWTDAALARADVTVAFGRVTLPHQLAAVVLAEQVYRAFTILAGHPYHTGH